MQEYEKLKRQFAERTTYRKLTSQYKGNKWKLWSEREQGRKKQDKMQSKTRGTKNTHLDEGVGDGGDLWKMPGRSNFS